MNNITVIYGILNKINDKQYIGSAINFRKRRNVHLKNLKENNHHSYKLQQDWNLFKENNFQFIIIEEIDDKTKLIEREQYWIDYYNPFYNISKVAGSSLGIKRRKETIEKIRKANLGLKHSEERNKIKSLAQGGEKHWVFGKFMKQETKQKKSKTMLFRYANGYKSPRTKKVNKFDLNGKLIQTFDSVKSAAVDCGYHYLVFIGYLKKGFKKKQKFIWKYD